MVTHRRIGEQDSEVDVCAENHVAPHSALDGQALGHTSSNTRVGLVRAPAHVEVRQMGRRRLRDKL